MAGNIHGVKAAKTKICHNCAIGPKIPAVQKQSLPVKDYMSAIDTTDSISTGAAATGGTGFAPDELLPGVGPVVPGSGEVATKGGGLAKRLQRVTHSGRFIPEVDGLRFIAIASVVLYHLCGQLIAKSNGDFAESGAVSPLARLLDSGHFGVQLFFAISGFILALPFAAQHLTDGRPVSLPAYYLRRVTRLEPPYLLSLLCFFGLIVLTSGVSATELFPHLLASVFYLHNLIYAEGSAINYVAWSLEVEVQFYLLAPFIALLFRLRPVLLRRAVLLVLILIFIAAQNAGGNETSRFMLSVLGQGQFFLIGFLLADFYLTEWRDLGKTAKTGSSWGWDIVSLVGWPLLWVSLRHTVFVVWAFPFALFVLYAAALRGNWFRRVISWPFFTVIGGMCYSIYLIHFQIIAAVWRVTSKLRVGESFAANFLLQCVLMLPIIVGVSALFYVIVERPCMSRDWPLRLAAKMRSGLPQNSTKA